MSHSESKCLENKHRGLCFERSAVGEISSVLHRTKQFVYILHVYIQNCFTCPNKAVCMCATGYQAFGAVIWREILIAILKIKYSTQSRFSKTLFYPYIFFHLFLHFNFFNLKN